MAMRRFRANRAPWKRHVTTSTVAAMTLACFAGIASGQGPVAPPPLAEPAVPATAPQPAQAPPKPSPTQIDDLDQRTRILERRLRLAGQDAGNRVKEAPVVGADDKGFALRSADGSFGIRLKGLIQTDGRFFFDNSADAAGNTFVVRKARPIVEASLFGIGELLLVPDFGNGQAVVQDAYVSLRPVTWLTLQAGKLKPPVGLERLQSEVGVAFPERALPTALVPNRDVGVQLSGDVAGGVLSYAIGVWNGVPDGASGDLDGAQPKDYVGRLFLQPWKRDPDSVLYGLGFGVAGSEGRQNGTPSVITNSVVTTASAPGLATYKTAGQQTFFSYLVNDAVPDSTTLAGGRRERLSPQAYYYCGPLGIVGEYVLARQRVMKGAAAERLTHRSWQVLASLVLTGDRNTHQGVQVARPFDPAKGAWGALEVAARFNVLDIDNAAFPTFADPSKSVRVARGAGLVVNWHLDRALKLAVSGERTQFKGGAANGGDRQQESLVITRVQGVF